LTVLGWSQHQIAADLGVSQAAVSKILRRAEERLLRDLRAVAERQKVRHTLRLEHLFAQAMQA
jgi:predicted transcriptional regulator